MQSGFSYSQGAQGVPVFIAIMIIFSLIVGLAMAAVMVYSFCKIFSKAGYSWAFGLLVLVPLGNVVIPLVLALMEWPILKRVRQLKHEQQSNQQWSGTE